MKKFEICLYYSTILQTSEDPGLRNPSYKISNYDALHNKVVPVTIFGRYTHEIIIDTIVEKLASIADLANFQFDIRMTTLAKKQTQFIITPDVIGKGILTPLNNDEFDTCVRHFHKKLEDAHEAAIRKSANYRTQAVDKIIGTEKSVLPASRPAAPVAVSLPIYNDRSESSRRRIEQSIAGF